MPPLDALKAESHQKTEAVIFYAKLFASPNSKHIIPLIFEFFAPFSGKNTEVDIHAEVRIEKIKNGSCLDCLSNLFTRDVRILSRINCAVQIKR